MSKTYDRLSISLDPDEGIDAEDVDEIVERSDYESRSEYIRELIRADTEDDC